MIPQPHIAAFHHIERLIHAVYSATDRLPRATGAEMIRDLRTAACAAGDSFLDGCSQATGAGRRHRWAQALVLLEEAANLVDTAADAGWMDPDTVLALLEVQSAAVVQVLILLDRLPAAEPVALAA